MRWRCSRRVTKSTRSARVVIRRTGPRRTPPPSRRCWPRQHRLRLRPQLTDAHMAGGGFFMKRNLVLMLIAAGGLFVIRPAYAHHAFAAEYDESKPVTLNGVVTRMEWANPHGWIYLDTKEPGGMVKHWMIETAAPSQLTRHGLKKADFTDGMM